MPTIEQIQAARILDQLQRADARAYVMRVLRRVLVSVAPEVWKDATDADVTLRARIMVRNTERGCLDDHDSRVMGEFGLAMARELAGRE